MNVQTHISGRIGGHIIVDAGQLADDCPCREPGWKVRDGDTRCVPDLYRRVAYLHLAQQDRPGALRVANQALDAATEDEARARAFVCRGIAHRLLGDPTAAIDDLWVALELLPLGGRWPWIRQVRWTYQTGALQDLTLAFSFSDNLEDVRKGLDLIPVVRKRWRNLRRVSSARAELDWTQAGLMLKANQIGLTPGAELLATRCDAIELLENAVEHVDSPYDRAAMSADLAAAYLPDMLRIVAVIGSVACPPELAAHRERILQARGIVAVVPALRGFRGAVTQLGSPPPVFSYRARR